ncbi:MAG: CrcB family protein [Microbacteriaceae bacterium]
MRRRSRDSLPMNSDIEVARTVVGVPVIIRLRPSYFGLVVLGGALGAAARLWLVLLSPSWHTLSAGTAAVNLLGPYFLGVLLQALAQRPETKNTRALRLMLAVGFLGAFTSYAQLAVDAVVLSQHSEVLLAVGYVLATIVTGAAAAWLGIFTASHWPRAWSRQGSRTE